ncbi:MAG: tetratricopeptide repeat protein [Candidatus Gracilibacteria bacterium]|nr:tetratricopeptide repeat protein [Candidatus Gracilibacteria bacterium]
MNKKIIIIIAIITTIIISGILAFIFKDNLFGQNSKDRNLSDDINNLINSSSEASGGEESAGSSIDVLRKRYTIQGVVLKGDYYLNNNQPLFALTKYLQALKSSPNDEKVKLKIADTYFELKKWSKAWEFYKNLTNNPKASSQKIILSSIYSLQLVNSGTTNDIIKSINSINIDKEQKFYYINSINCSIDFHKCKRAFEDYIAKNEVKTKEMTSIKRALDNYKNFATEKVYYKDSLLAGSFYEMKLYPISIKISKEILSTMPNYRPIQLILGKSYFELGDNYSAKKQLEDYYTLNPNDAKVSYLLGIINFNLQDYAGSNMYYNNAIKNLYKPKIDLERRLAYNYFLLKEDKKMLSIFYSLLKEKDVEMTDYSLGIYNAIMLGENTLAQIWIKKAMEKYPKEEIFYGYSGWIYREAGDLVNARIELEKGLKINSRNPMITLNMAYLLEREGKYPMALIYAKKTILANEGGEFGTLAQKETENLNKLISANK